jgi:hypothetical protein
LSVFDHEAFPSDVCVEVENLELRFDDGIFNPPNNLYLGYMYKISSIYTLYYS